MVERFGIPSLKQTNMNAYRGCRMSDDRSASSGYPTNSTAKPYKDQDGNTVTLRQLISLEPEWAHSRIKRCEELEARIGALEAKAGTAPRDVVQGLVDAAHFVITNNLPDEVEGVSALAKSTGAVGAALSDTTTGDKE